jgi:hypothetical protein
MKKEANLISSPVLREFYNEALKNKWITEEELTKSASVSIDKYAATGNYTQDLVNLASGLRELGLYEQAESLEVKLNIFKKAQLAFSNLIDEQSRALQQAAHAESAKVVDAQGGWGVVHTNMDRQRKILETLTHQPGVSSQAPVMQNLVTAAAEALGLLKFADAELALNPEAGAGASRKIALTPEQREKARTWVLSGSNYNTQGRKLYPNYTGQYSVASFSRVGGDTTEYNSDNFGTCYAFTQQAIESCPDIAHPAEVFPQIN